METILCRFSLQTSKCFGLFQFHPVFPGKTWNRDVMDTLWNQHGFTVNLYATTPCRNNPISSVTSRNSLILRWEIDLLPFVKFSWDFLARFHEPHLVSLSSFSYRTYGVTFSKFITWFRRFVTCIPNQTRWYLLYLRVLVSRNNILALGGGGAQ